MKTINVWRNGNWETINNEMDFFIGRTGSGHTVFGENARLVKVLKNNLVFETESGTIVKTEIDSLATTGKAKKENYFVSVGKREYEGEVIQQKVSYWNKKTLRNEYK